MTETVSQGLSLIAQFRELRDPKRMAEPVRLPPHIPNVVSKESDCQTYFDIAQKAWEEVYDTTHLQEIARVLASGDPTISTNQQQAWLEEIGDVRKFGLILKSAWILFDQSHYAPPDHHKLAYLLGEVKDSYFQPERRKAAEDLLAHLQKMKYSEEKPQFHPTTLASFHEYMEKILATIRLSFHDQLTTEQFHSIRKDGTRHMMNLYQIAAIVRRTPDVLETFRYLQQIDLKLGKKHDQIVQEAPNAPLTEKSVQVDEESKRCLGEFLRAYESLERFTA